MEDDPLAQHALRQVFGRYGACRVVASAAEAAATIQLPWDGLVIDVRLPDGSGLDVLARAREAGTHTPALVMTGAIDAAVVNRAAALDARVVGKPWEDHELAPFVAAVASRPADRARERAEVARQRWKLTETETSVLEFAIRGGSRENYMREHDITANTYKSHVRSMLAKCAKCGDAHDDLASLVVALWNEAPRDQLHVTLGGRPPHRPVR